MQEKGSHVRLSIVTTLYCSADHLREFHERISAAARRVTDDYELIFVNDGSPDGSLDVALDLFRRDHRVRVIDLSRNFRHHKATLTGLAHARGELVFKIDCDLEEAPELLPEFCEVLQRHPDADAVFGVQQRRKGRWFERLSGSLFYRVFNFLSDTRVPENQCSARLMTRRFVESLTAHRDREVFMSGLLALTGYRQIAHPVTKHDKGSSTYGLGRKLALAVTAVTSFSSRPLVMIFHLGMLIFLGAAIAALCLIVRRLAFGGVLTGWASLIVSIWLLGGITIFCIGLLGVYLATMFSEIKPRPYTIVRRIYEHRPPNVSEPQHPPAPEREQAPASEMHHSASGPA